MPMEKALLVVGTKGDEIITGAGGGSGLAEDSQEPSVGSQSLFPLSAAGALTPEFAPLSLPCPVAESHAKLEYKSGRLFCTALLGEFMTDPTLTWIDGVELRPGVAYMVAPGAIIAFGEQRPPASARWPCWALTQVRAPHPPPLPSLAGTADNSITVDFTEVSAGNAMADMLMKVGGCVYYIQPLKGKVLGSTGSAVAMR